MSKHTMGSAMASTEAHGTNQQPSEVDVSRLIAGLRRSPRERLDHAYRLAWVMERFRRAKRLGPVQSQ